MSRYSNYVMKNNVFAELDAPISSLATTIQLKTGQGARRGTTFPILATLESFDSDGKCTKREIVRITAVSGDNLTVVRGVAPCPSSDDSNSQGTTTFSFQADDKISLYITKEHFDEIDDSINDIYDNGVNKLRTEVISGLQIKVNPGPVLVGSGYYDFEGGNLTLTDDATNYIEIDQNGDLTSNTTAWNDKSTKISKVITSGGEITSIEDWRLGTVGGEIGGVNIHDLTEKIAIKPNDELLIADSDNIYNNKKIKYSTIYPDPFGTGADGCCRITSACVADSNDPFHSVFMQAKEYNFTNFIIDPNITLRFCGDGTPLIRVQGCFCNRGIICMRGQTLTEKHRGLTLSGTVINVSNTGSMISPHCNCGGCGGGWGYSYCGGNGGGYSASGTGTGGSGYGGSGQSGPNAGGGGASSNRMDGSGNYSPGSDGNQSTGIGGDGGNGKYYGGNCWFGGGGGGGRGKFGGGNGGNGECGGSGGDSIYGNGGNAGISCGICSAGNGGSTIYGNGGNGGANPNGAYPGGCGGSSVYGNGGDGGATGISTRGGDSIYGNGGNGGCCGGDSLGGVYGLIVLASNIYNNVINANGGNGGCGATQNGLGTNGGDVALIYKCSLTLGTVCTKKGFSRTETRDGCQHFLQYVK